jgi:hypothetical protein
MDGNLTGGRLGLSNGNYPAARFTVGMLFGKWKVRAVKYLPAFFPNTGIISGTFSVRMHDSKSSSR